MYRSFHCWKCVFARSYVKLLEGKVERYQKIGYEEKEVCVFESLTIQMLYSIDGPFSKHGLVVRQHAS